MTAPAAIAPSNPPELDIRPLKDLAKDGRHDEALAGAQALLETSPDNRDLLLLAASSQRHLMRLDEALATLDRLERVSPRFSLLHQERGLCYVALKNAPRAIEALLTAVNINPALPVSWRMLEGVYRITGDVINSATAADHVATLKHLPPDVVTATSLFEDGDLDPAEPIIRAFLIKNGNHPDAMRLLARIGIAREVFDDAETLLEAVLMLGAGLRCGAVQLRAGPGVAPQICDGARADRAADETRSRQPRISQDCRHHCGRPGRTSGQRSRSIATS